MAVWRVSVPVLGHPTFAGVLNSLAWGATIAFGATVLVARFRHAPSRTLGLQVFGLGVLGILINLMDIEQDPGMDRLYLRAAMVLAIVEPFALLAFLMSWPWPRLRGGAALWSWGPLAPALGLVAAFVADPDPWIPAFAFVVFTTWLLAGVTAFVIFLQAFSLQPGPARESAFVVGVAVASAVIVDTVFWTLARWAPPTRLIDFLAWALSLLGLYLSVLVVLLYMIRRRSLGEERLRVRDRMVLVLPVGALAGSLASVAAHYVVSPALGYQVWEIAGALQCAGAIVVLVNAAAKHQMLGLEFGIKWTLRRGTVAAAFVGAYFLASEGAQLVLAERFGPLIGLGGAALLVVGLSPLQRIADRVAETAMPGVKPLGSLTRDERSRLYLDQAKFAWADGTLTARDRQILDVARKRLGLGTDESDRLERRAMRAAIGA